jgi:predicted regulator of Ras-like GTPase activity (Roadblock/LC7/MglB family)
MNREPYAISLQCALTEIKKAYPGIHHSFLFTETGSVITTDSETDEKTVQNVLESFEDLKEKAKTLGNVKGFSVAGKDGKLFLSGIDNMYLVMVTSKQVEEPQVHSITKVIIPTILKTVETLSTSNLQPSPEKKLVVDIISGFFAGDSVQIDEDALVEWTNILSRQNMGENDGEKPDGIDHVRVETFAGNSVLCKVKEIADPKLKGKNLVRIPEKISNTLVVKKGDHVLVKPLL